MNDQKKNVIPTQRVESVDSKVASEQPTADASVEAAEAKNRANIQRALLKGKSEWGRSKIMIVGEGRAGKSAFANTIIGRPFSDTESTVGINQLTCDIKYASIGSGNGWAESKRPERELEAAVAVMVAAGDVAESIGTDKASTSAQPAVQLGDKSDLLSAQSAAAFKLRSRAVHSAAESSVVPNGSAVGLHSKPTALASIGENGQIGKYMDETMGADMQEDHVMLDENAAKSYDSELIMKCLADKVQTASKLLLSVYDFGGQSVFNVSHHVNMSLFKIPLT